jgi:hypothetical protein
MWECRIADRHHLPVDQVAVWSETAFVSAVATMTAEAERCQSCGTSPDDQWWITADTTVCFACTDRDLAQQELAASAVNGVPPAGVRIRWRTLERAERWLSARSKHDPVAVGARLHAELEARERLQSGA